jgi:hypothetical protein
MNGRKLNIRLLTPSVIALSLVLIFWLPWHIPIQRSVSSSYLFGYSNKAFVGLLLLFVALLAMTRHSHIVDLPRIDSPPIQRTTLACLLAIVALICSAMYVLTKGLGGYDESRYLIDRIGLLAEGQTPYRSFEFAYGPLFLYGPLAIARMFHVAIETGYYVFWFSSTILGYYLLYKTINQLDFPCSHKRTIFLAFSGGMMPAILNTGINYTLLRFVLPAYFSLLIYRHFKADDRYGYIQSLLLLVLTVVVIGSLSPEIAIAYGIGALGFMAIYGRLTMPLRFLAYGATAALLSFLAYSCNRLGLFDTLKDFAGGGANFPVIPALHILFLVFCTLVSGYYLVGRLYSRSPHDGISLVIATALPALPAAFGRCDMGHALFCALGITLSGSILAARDARIWRWYRYPFLCIVVLIPFFTGVLFGGAIKAKLFLRHVFASEVNGKNSGLDDLIERGMAYKLGSVKAREKFSLIKASSVVPYPIDLARIFPKAHGALLVPFGFFPNQIGMYHDPSLDPGRYNGLVNVVSEKSVARKIGELELKPNQQLLLPSNFADSCLITPDDQVKAIRMLFLFPFDAKPVHLDSVLQPVCSYITTNYRREQSATPQTFGYELWAPIARK